MFILLRPSLLELGVKLAQLLLATISHQQGQPYHRFELIGSAPFSSALFIFTLSLIWL